MTAMRAWTLDDIRWVRSRYVDIAIAIGTDIPTSAIAEEATKHLRRELDLELRGLEIQPHDLQRHNIRPPDDEPRSFSIITARYRWWPSATTIRIEGAGSAHGQEWDVRTVGEPIRIAVRPRPTAFDATTPGVHLLPSVITLELTGWDPCDRVWIYEPR